MKILVTYHSGVGNTKFIANMLNNKLKQTFETDFMAIEQIKDSSIISDYDGYIIGFPTYHAHPSVSIMQFIQSIKILHHKKPAYIFTTCGWFSANTLRIFAKMCMDKNIIPVGSRSFRAIATDGILFAPFLKPLFTFEKNLEKKVGEEAEKIKSAFYSEKYTEDLPPFSFMSIINYPNKKLGHWITFKIFLHKKNCTKCGKCIRNCNMAALQPDPNGYPMFYKKKCEKCYRCIHHCSSKALSLSKRKIPKIQWRG